MFPQIYRVMAKFLTPTTNTNQPQGSNTKMSDLTLDAAQTRHDAETAASDAAQQTKFNQGTPYTPDSFDTSDTDTNGFEAGQQAMAQFINWQGNVLARLGLTSLTGDVAADNPTLVAALAKIKSTGAPAPKVVRETVAWPGGDVAQGGAFTVDVYEFTHPHEPTNVVRCTEFLLAANPAIAINELVKARIISDPNA